MMKTRIVWIPLLLAWISISCTDPDESSLPLYSPGMSTPVVTGIRITTPAGPSVVAVWGNPSDPMDPVVRYGYPADSPDTAAPVEGQIPDGYACSAWYPNPSDGSTVAEFAVPKSSLVDLWIVRARWWETPDTDPVPVLGSTVPVPVNLAVRTVIRHVVMPAGSYRFTWEGRDDNGDPVPSGFYRLYLKAGTYSTWRDMFLYRSLNDIPSGLRSIIHR